MDIIKFILALVWVQHPAIVFIKLAIIQIHFLTQSRQKHISRKHVLIFWNFSVDLTKKLYKQKLFVTSVRTFVILFNFLYFDFMTPRESPEVFCTFIKSSIDHLYEVFKSVFNRTSCQSAGFMDSHSAKALKTVQDWPPMQSSEDVIVSCVFCLIFSLNF